MTPTTLSGSVRTRLTTLAVIAVLVAACGGDGGGGGASATTTSAGSGELTVTATEFAFDPERMEISAGTTIVLVNEGVVEHDITVEGIDFQLHADPGETTSAALTASPGTYDVFCSIPGHKEAGMTGTLVVR